MGSGGGVGVECLSVELGSILLWKDIFFLLQLISNGTITWMNSFFSLCHFSVQLAKLKQILHSRFFSSSSFYIWQDIQSNQWN